MFAFSTRVKVLDAINNNNWQHQESGLFLIAYPETGAATIQKNLTRVARELNNHVELFTDLTPGIVESLNRSTNTKHIYLTRSIAEVAQALWYAVPNGHHQQYLEARNSSETVQDFAPKVAAKLDEFEGLKSQLISIESVRVDYIDMLNNPDLFLIDLCNFLFK